MAYRNVKVQKKANSVVVERVANGYVVRPEYPGRSYEERPDDYEVFTSIEATLRAVERAVTTGITKEEERWVEEKTTKY